MLQEEPHSQKAAEAAIGLQTDNGRRLVQELQEPVLESIAMDVEI